MLQTKAINMNQTDKMPPALRASFEIAVWPLVLGFSMLFGALLTGSAIFGIWGILIALISFPFNLLCLVDLSIFRFKSRSDEYLLSRWRRAMWACFVILLLNYPVAIACFLIGSSYIFSGED